MEKWTVVIKHRSGKRTAGRAIPGACWYGRNWSADLPTNARIDFLIEKATASYGSVIQDIIFSLVSKLSAKLIFLISTDLFFQVPCKTE